MSFAAGPSRQPTFRRLEGSRPGALDTTQPSRVLSIPGSTLSFASFDPLTASGSSAQTRRRAPDADPARPRRVVIETPPRGPSRWRFVPRARRAQGVEDEGMWPRKVNICGEYFLCSEDQWDIYKLDPAYECFVPASPDHPTVVRKDPSFEDMSINNSNRGSTIPTNSKKRRGFSPVVEEDSNAGPAKKSRIVQEGRVIEVEDDASSDEEDEVVEIMFDGEGHEETLTSRKRAARAAQRRREREQNARERRREPAAQKPPSTSVPRPTTPEIVDLTMEDSSSQDPSQDPTPEPTFLHDITATGTTKRKVFATADPSEDHSPTQDRFKPSKRARTQSPPRPPRSDLNRKLKERRMARCERERVSREERDEQLWQDILADVADGSLPTPPPSQSNGADAQLDEEGQAESSPHLSPDNEEAARLAAIEESRRKLADLEKDRPLWDEEARKRAAQARAEEEASRARKQAEAARARAAEREEQERRRTAEAEARRRAEAERARIERERQQRRQRERERWSYGPWTTTRAIERYRTLSETFDAAKFTAEDPVDFERIPWPVLLSPMTLHVEDIDWSAVEAFFDAARRHMRAQDFKTFVEKSHKRFHPDRWRARGVLKSVADEAVRGSLEVAANTVAQAITPIWRETKS